MGMLAEHKGRPVMRLKDKVAIVTGGAHGMGASEARLFTAPRRTLASCDGTGRLDQFPGGTSNGWYNAV
jgi:NAD(P)-dependent dehydrogenase (short-subunit alcohol dehydrogenase family)